MDYSYEVAKAIQEERLHKAERMRMLKQAEAARPDFRAKALIGLGDILITVGLKVKEQYQTQQPSLELT